MQQRRGLSQPPTRYFPIPPRCPGRRGFATIGGVRILLVNGRLSERGGAHRWLLGVVARLRGCVETVLAVGAEDAGFPAAERARIGAVRRVKGLDGRGLGRARGGAAGRLRALIEEIGPDVVHANDVTDPALLDVVADSGRGMLTVQDHRFFCPGRGKVDLDDRPCRDPMGDSCMRCFDDAGYGRAVLDLTRRRLAAAGRMRRVAVLSRYMAGELVAAGLRPGRVVRIPPFVDALPAATSADAAAGDFHLLAGRLSAHKGVEVALAAARALRFLPLVVAGEGPLAETVRAHAQERGDRVRFVGWANRTDLAVLLSRARSLWLPSLWAEPFGIVGLEALARGVPVIGSDSGGVTDWLTDGHDGLLVRPGSPEELARAAERLAAEPSLAQRLGENGRRRVASEFAPSRQMRLLLDTYAEVVRSVVS